MQKHNISHIIKLISDNIVDFSYFNANVIKHGNNAQNIDKKKQTYDIYYDLLMVFLTRSLIPRDYSNPIRQYISDIDSLEQFDDQFTDCILTAKFQLSKNTNYISFYSDEELQKNTSGFTSDNISCLINENLFSEIFKQFIPLEIFFFTNNKQVKTEAYLKIVQCIDSTTKNKHNLDYKIDLVLDYLMKYVDLQGRVYLAQLLLLDYRDMLCSHCNDFIKKGLIVKKIKHTVIDYYY